MSQFKQGAHRGNDEPVRKTDSICSARSHRPKSRNIGERTCKSKIVFFLTVYSLLTQLKNSVAQSERCWSLMAFFVGTE